MEVSTIDIPHEVELIIIDFVDERTFFSCLYVCKKWYVSLTSSIRGNEIYFHKFRSKYKKVVADHPEFEDYLSHKFLKKSLCRNYWRNIFIDFAKYESQNFVTTTVSSLNKWTTYFNVVFSPSSSYIVTTGKGDLSIWKLRLGSKHPISLWKYYTHDYLKMSAPSISSNSRKLIVTNIPHDTGMRSVFHQAQLFDMNVDEIETEGEEDEEDEEVIIRVNNLPSQPREKYVFKPSVGFGEIIEARTSNAFFLKDSENLVVIPSEEIRHHNDNDDDDSETASRFQSLQIYRTCGRRFCEIVIRNCPHYVLDYKITYDGKYLLGNLYQNEIPNGDVYTRLDIKEQVTQILEYNEQVGNDFDFSEVRQFTLDLKQEPRKFRKLEICSGYINNTKISSDGKYCLINSTTSLPNEEMNDINNIDSIVPMELHVIKIKDFSSHRVLTSHYGNKYLVMRMDVSTKNKYNDYEIVCCGCIKKRQILIWSVQFGFVIRRISVHDPIVNVPHVAICQTNPFVFASVGNYSDVKLISLKGSVLQKQGKQDQKIDCSEEKEEKRR